jgi:hypothetical protein
MKSGGSTKKRRIRAPDSYAGDFLMVNKSTSGGADLRLRPIDHAYNNNKPMLYEKPVLQDNRNMVSAEFDSSTQSRATNYQAGDL